MAAMTNLPGGGETKDASGAQTVPLGACWFCEKGLLTPVQRTKF